MVQATAQKLEQAEPAKYEKMASAPQNDQLANKSGELLLPKKR